jgi:fructokinase
MAALAVVAGEALVDLVLGSGDDDALRAHAGGGPYNTARTLGRLGTPVAFLGRLSTDRFGTHLRRELERDGVRLDAVVTTDDPTTLALAELDAGGAATYRFYTRGTAAAGLTPEDARAGLPDGAGVLHVGTLGLVLEPTAGALEALVADAGDDLLVVLDPNCRPAAITDEPGYRARLGRLLERADVVKASEDDLAWLVPGAPPETAMRGLLARPGAVGLVTLGGEGALVVHAGAAAHVPAPRVEVVDTIGAGDVFNAAYLASMLRGGGLAEAVRAGVETASIAISTRPRRYCGRSGPFGHNDGTPL